MAVGHLLLRKAKASRRDQLQLGDQRPASRAVAISSKPTVGCLGQLEKPENGRFHEVLDLFYCLFCIVLLAFGPFPKPFHAVGSDF